MSAGRGTTVEVDQAAWNLLLTDYLRVQCPSFSACYRRTVEGYATPRGITLPSESTLRRKLDREVDLRVLSFRRGASR